MAPSRDISILDQFNTFLELQDEIEDRPLQMEIGSPYFNHNIHLFASELHQANSKVMPL